ncbi:efflux RND transporter periplasmic adaptor subunit [Usitatibacter palustris]|uniref:Multidrug resistance protein MdtA n=1 Tax=Usitatibacter palustris TaxID=2732487 RepID=A0A6M4H7S4_9PROT|nr:efflux RND transporter periplasmic adaptor subunit [Usitatibacter palustris]QJR14928.1 Multidrug resistance protein MdtA [Usitatibacter palustris]
MTDESRTAIRRAKLVAIVILVLLALGAGRTVFMRHTNAKTLEANAADSAKLYVQVAAPKIGGTGETVVLAGSLQGATQAPLSSRASGYLKRWTKDIGSVVEKGELLAEIESPEIDQQLTQARAARQQSAASLALAKSTMDRYEELKKTGFVAQQSLDERRGAYAQAQANLAEADANVERLKQLESFRRVVAPFRGVITRRNVDVGDLIDAGSGRPLFILTQADSLRVYVNVPQSSAHLVKAGQKVNITQGELRGRVFEGQVARTSAAIDPNTRTMQVEIALDNKDGALLPGAYVQVALPLTAAKEMVIPANALIIRAEGVQVAAVEAGKVRLQAIKVGRNLGTSVEVIDGLKGTEQLVLNPPDSIVNGDAVTIAK